MPKHRVSVIWIPQTGKLGKQPLRKWNVQHHKVGQMDFKRWWWWWCHHWAGEGVVNVLSVCNAHISAVCRSSYYHLKNIAKIPKYLSDSDVAKIIHALVTSRLDYCNAVMVSLPNSSISKLQRVLHNAARVLARVKMSKHITPILRHYHWLPVKKRIKYKILTLVLKALHNTALLTITQSHYSIRSFASTILEVPRTWPTHDGDRAFVHVAPVLWNKLPSAIRNIQCLETFQKHVTNDMLLKFLSENVRREERVGIAPWLGLVRGHERPEYRSGFCRFVFCILFSPYRERHRIQLYNYLLLLLLL